jgi:DNA polymerase/3'-5' exonuclease PolX
MASGKVKASGKNSRILREFDRLIIYINWLLQHATTAEDKNKQQFRLRSFEKARKVLAKIERKITSGESLKGVPGIGKGVMDRVDQILKNGELEELKGLDVDNLEEATASDDLMTVIGIGGSKAKELVSLGVKSVKDLKRKVAKGEIVVNDKILMGLKYHGTDSPIPRSEIEETQTFLQSELKKLDPKCKGQVCGSFRRGRDFSGDVDFLFIHPDVVDVDDVDGSDLLNRFVARLKKCGFIIDSLTDGDLNTKFMGFSRLGKDGAVRRIDIRFLPAKSWPAAILYFTGPGAYNQKMRKIAKRKGYLLNEYGLYRRVGKDKYRRVRVKTERDIYTVLGISWSEPHERDTAEI